MAVPSLIQHASINQWTDSTTSFVMFLPDPCLAGNCIIVSVFNAQPQTVSSVVDDGSNTYVNKKTQVDGTNQRVTTFVALNVAASRKITVTFSAASTFIMATVTEFTNVATSSAVDVTTANTLIATTVTAGSFTPSVTGELLYQVGFQDSNGPGQSTVNFTAGSQSNITWALAPAGTSTLDGSFVQWGVYNSTSAINPQATADTSLSYITIALGLKSGASGSVPGTGIRVAGIQHVAFSTLTPITIQFVSTGNLQILTSSSEDGISTITSNNGNTWQKRVSKADPTNLAIAEVWDSVNATASPSGGQKITITMLSGVHGFHDILLYDVSGAATAPFDITANANGNQSGSGLTTLSTGSITPTTANGLVVVVAPIGIGTATALAGANQLIDTSAQTPQHEPTELDQNNPYGHFYNPDTSAVSWTWTLFNASTGAGDWAYAAASYKAPALVIARITPPSLRPAIFTPG